MDTLNLFASDSLPASPADVTAPETDQIGDQSGPEVAALKRATGVYNCAWSLFTSPPHENPNLNSIERQPSAAPYHDWNQRIYAECYRPNAFARILNCQGEILEIVNNFEFLSLLD